MIIWIHVLKSHNNTGPLVINWSHVLHISMINGDCLIVILISFYEHWEIAQIDKKNYSAQSNNALNYDHIKVFSKKTFNIQFNYFKWFQNSVVQNFPCITPDLYSPISVNWLFIEVKFSENN